MFTLRRMLRFLWVSGIPNAQWAWYMVHHSRYSTGSFWRDYSLGVTMLWNDVVTAHSLHRRALQARRQVADRKVRNE